MIELYKGDCLELMKTIESGSVDAIITDPPYGTTACKWDSVINFDLMWEQLNRIIKPNGAIVLFGSEPFSSALRMSNIKNYKYDWVWEKSRKTGHMHAKNKPLKKHENILVFSKGVTAHKSQSKNRMEYNPQGLLERKNKVNFRPSREAKGSDVVGGWRPSNKNTLISEFTNYPSSVLGFNSEHNVNAFHPTQKPIALMEYLIKTYTNENETVLDFTMGSGSTGVAAKNLNRSFIGIEMDDNYFNIARKRIEEIDYKLF
jgi:site-specific DNA-methyltransferase (adenine-specific)